MSCGFYDGFFKESINEFKVCLNTNDMHIPSLNGKAKVYEKLDDNESAEKYKDNIPVLYSVPIVNMDWEQSRILIE
jgi:hypothetical protein